MALRWLKKDPSATQKPAAAKGPESRHAPLPSEDPHAQADTLTPDTAAAASTPPPGEATPAKKGFFKRLKRGLAKTRSFLTTDLESLFAGKHRLDDELLEELEELLITADIGVRTAMDLIDRISRRASAIDSADQLKAVLRSEILALMPPLAPLAPPDPVRPHVIMVVGVNGVGKTTTIGKLAAKWTAAGQRVLISAADTFRAAATEQLTIWAERAGADIVRHQEHADPAAVAYDSIDAALARGSDVVLIDTAGRLHTKINLMEELKKIKRTVGKKLSEAPHEVLLVLDATTGQNALAQAEMFHAALTVTGIALTKLDGTAKGGIAVSICNTLQIPLQYIGVGEAIEDLQVFEPQQYVEALF